ncbi:MAG: hypothetical protein Q7T44_01075 [Parvibaculum sp.]|nr:hypothetical protein [Parvibaculum sp.]
MLSLLKTVAQNGLSESVVRRAITLLAFTIPASLINLLFTYVAAHKLEPDEFGIFYAAITAINILFAPAVIFNLLFSRYVSTLYAESGSDAARHSHFIVLSTTLRWLSAFTFVGLAAVVILGVIGGFFSAQLAMVVIIIVATSYFAECGRIFLQGEHRFLTLGIYTLIWMSGRLVFGTIGLWVFGTVWSGLAGVVFAAPVVFFLFFGLKPLISKPAKIPDLLPPNLSELVPFAIGYAIFAAVAHADIIVAYLMLDPYQLGVYSASSVLPKGILMLTLPIIQLAFPLMVDNRVKETPGMSVMVKGFLLTSVVAASGVIVAIIFRETVCASRYGFNSCDIPTMIYAAVAMIPFVLVRFLISVDYSAHRDWVPGLLIVPLCIFVGLNLNKPLDSQGLATLFLIFSFIVLLLYPALRIAQPLLLRLMPQSP